MATSFTLSMLVGAGAAAVTQKGGPMKGQASPFECGMNNSLNEGSSISVHFFLVSMIFLIFDVEVVLLYPVVTATSGAPLSQAMVSFAGFVMLLTGGLLLEWEKGCLSWTD